MSKLNFIIAGAQRSGTTALKRLVAQHPDISFISNQPDKLSFDGKYVGFPFASPYHAISKVGHEHSDEVYTEISKSGGKARYLATKWPYFMVFPHIAANMRIHLPDVKILFILRNPVDCLWSTFRKTYSGDSIDKDFEEYVNKGIQEIEETGNAEQRSGWPNMLFTGASAAQSIDRGFYYPQLMHYFMLFGWSQIKVVNFKDFSRDGNGVANGVFRWMDLEAFEVQNASEKVNTAEEKNPGVKSKMLESTRDRLLAFYEWSNRKTCELNGWDYDDWIA